jgi:hypothetical protein
MYIVDLRSVVHERVHKHIGATNRRIHKFFLWIIRIRLSVAVIHESGNREPLYKRSDSTYRREILTTNRSEIRCLLNCDIRRLGCLFRHKLNATRVYKQLFTLVSHCGVVRKDVMQLQVGHTWIDG